MLSRLKPSFFIFVSLGLLLTLFVLAFPLFPFYRSSAKLAANANSLTGDLSQPFGRSFAALRRAGSWERRANQTQEAYKAHKTTLKLPFPTVGRRAGGEGWCEFCGIAQKPPACLYRLNHCSIRYGSCGRPKPKKPARCHSKNSGLKRPNL